MEIKYKQEIVNEAILVNLKRLTNQVYKLLPLREESGDWARPLETIIEEIAGMSRLLVGQQVILFKLLSKLEGLQILQEPKDFMLYRSIIFECLSLLGELGKKCQDQTI